MMHVTRSRWWLLGLGLCLTLLAAACGGSDDDAGGDDGAGEESSETATDESEASGEAEASTGGTLTVASNTPVSLWDQNSTTSNDTSGFAFPLVYGWLMKEVDGELVPDLLESATPSDDLLTWTLVLREGVVFSNGSPATADDLKFSLDMRANDPSWGYLLGSPAADDIVVVDDLTVEITLLSPNAEVGTLGLAAFSMNLHPADLAGLTEDEYFQNPVGAGPFVIESNSDAGMTLVKNPQYWDADSWALDAIEVAIVPDNSAKLIGFEAGDYDVITRQPTSVIDQLESAGSALIVNPSANVETVFLNSLLPPFDDINFRRAVWFGIDRETIAAGVFDGQAVPAMGMIPSALPNATPGATPPSYDPDAAAEALAASAYADDAAFELLLIDGDGARREQAQVIADQLGAIGIDVSVRPVGAAEWSEIVFSSTHQATMLGYEAVVTPPSDIVGFFAVTGFFGGYDTTEAFGQFLAIQAAPDAAGQSAALAEFETAFAENVYSVPVVEPFWVLGVADRVQGLRVPSTNILDFSGVTLSEN